MPTIRRLHHAQITVPKPDEDAARAFYCGVLGLKEIPKPASLADRGGFWVSLGELEIHIATEDGVDRTRSKAHLAYQVDDVAAWQQLLRDRGVEVADSIPIPGYARFEFRDPFGNRVEFIQLL
jgi:catechol 2,3-dioxygenase-like lactoylglutathione lyase family enzyme